MSPQFPARYGPLVGSVDQGTSSSRFLVFAANTSELVTFHQIEVPQDCPRNGWIEQDPKELLRTVYTCIDVCAQNLKDLGIDIQQIKSIGITNQRETTVVWDKYTGEPLYNAILWCDSRTAETVEHFLAGVPDNNKDYLKPRCGLPISTYFSALKLCWLMTNIPSVKKAVDEKRALFGTIDSWLIWNLTGGTDGGIHMSDVTNASRTMLLDIIKLQWDPYLCNFFKIPTHILPEVRSSSEIYGYLTGTELKGVPISGCLGDQQAALVGQMCLKEGEAKNTYGTGCFLLYNTGQKVTRSSHGMLTTVAYQMGKEAPACYAMEGSVAVAGAAIRWLRDGLGFAPSARELEELAATVKNTGGVYFVPAFNGLFAPYWRTDARGTICGITQYTTKAHITRAALEAVCYQTREILEAMTMDSGMTLQSLLVDGGMTSNDHLMQMQADILGLDVIRPCMAETTALGAAIAAGCAKGIDVWKFEPGSIAAIPTDVFHPGISEDERDMKFAKWKKAVQRSLSWETVADKNKTMTGQDGRNGKED